MRPRKHLPLTLLALLLASSSALADPMTPPNDTRARAMQSISQADTTPRLAELYRLARSGDDTALLLQLESQASRDDLPAAARDYILYTFAISLGDLEAGSVGPVVFQYLESTSPRVRVPHPDHPRVGVPLFNIPAAASGSRTRWHYDEARASGQRLLALGSTQWLTAYLDESPAGRQGMLDGLANATATQTRQVGEQALAGTNKRDERTEVATRSALMLQDPDMLRFAILNGRGPALTAAIRDMHDLLTPLEVVDLAAEASTDAPPATAALIFAESTDRLAGEVEMSELLFSTLPNPELGGAAALALARNPNPEVRARLQAIADDGDSLPARRAQLALGLLATAETRQ